MNTQQIPSSQRQTRPARKAVALATAAAVLLGQMPAHAQSGGGLPVIRDADRLSIFDLARVTKELADACRSGSIGLDALEGGTFAVTSLGTYGVDFFTPVINPGNVGILGVGRLRDSGKWEGDRFVKTQVLTLSLTFDHRAVDGAPAAEFLQTMNELLARPLVLLPGA